MYISRVSIVLSIVQESSVKKCKLHFLPRQRLLPFRNRSLPFLTVDAIIGNQAFSYGLGLGFGLAAVYEREICHVDSTS